MKIWEGYVLTVIINYKGVMDDYKNVIFTIRRY